MAYASVNGVELYYDEFGSGDQVVICASGGDFKHPDPDVWPYYMASYGYHLYTVTLRGHWKSTHITEDYGKEWYNIWADDIYEFGKLVGAKRFVYMGLSHGSGVGWHLADRHPEVLKSFIAIVCGPHYLCGDLNEKQTSFARERTIQAADDPELKLQLIKEQEPDWSRIPPERLEEEKRRWQEHYEGWMEMSPEEMRLRPRIAFAWIDTEEELMDYFAIGQCTPGVIAVNTATFIGQKQRGIAGGILATLGVVFPSLVIISLLAGVITTFSHLAWVQHAFGGVRVCVCILILNAVVKLYKKAVIDGPTLLVFLAVALGSYLTPLSPVLFVLAAAVVGIALKNMGVKK